jgi:hypothetical protein
MSGGSSRRYPPELQRAVRMVAEISDQHESEWAAISEVARLGRRHTEIHDHRVRRRRHFVTSPPADGFACRCKQRRVLASRPRGRLLRRMQSGKA